MAEKRDLEALGGQISSIVNRLRKGAAKGTTGGISAGTSIKSLFGYQRWSKTGEEAVGSDGVQNTELSNTNSPTEEKLPLNQEDDSYGDVVSSADENAEHSLPSDEVLSKSSSCNSVDEPEEEPVSKVDSISEWQAGWNVTNAIQVCIFWFLL